MISGLAGNFLLGFVVTEIDEFRVAEDVAGRPSGEFYFGDGFGFESDVIFHVFGTDDLIPVTGPTAGKICERTAVSGKGLRM
jgi:hypothetical protein